MTYLFNPHQHVKIWLSLDRDSFLTTINRERLIKMRRINPTDVIHFVYDSRLLCPKACEELNQFCNEHSIQHHDFNSMMKSASLTPNEDKLAEEYEKQLIKIAQGFYVGSLSDIARWLGPIYRLGTYSDFDTNIDTSALNESIEVNAPLLLNFKTHRFNDRLQSIDINGDIISVVNETAAFVDIQKIQQRIVKNCTTCDAERSPYQDYVQAAHRTLAALNIPIGGSPDDLNRMAMHKLSQDKDVCELRDTLMTSTANNDIFTQFMAKNAQYGGMLANFQMLTLYLSDELKTKCRETFKHNSLMDSVRYITGAGPMVLSLFPHLLYEDSFLKENVLRYSYAQYGLDAAFFSGNNHFSERHTNDLSWCKDQNTVIQERLAEENKQKQAPVKAISSRGLFATRFTVSLSQAIEAVSLYNTEKHKKDLGQWLKSPNKHAVDTEGRSLLHHAAASGNLNLVSHFVEKQDFDVTLKDNHGHTAATHAYSVKDMIPKRQDKINACVEALSYKEAERLSLSK